MCWLYWAPKIAPLGSVNGLTLTTSAFSATYKVNFNVDRKVDGRSKSQKNQLGNSKA